MTNRLNRARHNAGVCWIATAAWLAFVAAEPPLQAQVVNDFASLVPIGTAYATNDINHVAFRGKAITSVVIGEETYQFAAYYRHQASVTPNRRVTLARRLLGSTTWQLFDYTFGDSNSNGGDSHNTISLGIDRAGYMHMSYGMHNNSLIYRKSTAPVTNASPIAFGNTMPMIGAGGAANNENSVTYPQFYNLPDGDLLFFYRNGASGDGNNYLNRYDTTGDSWSVVHHPLQNGIISGVNPYPNMMAFDSQDRLHLTWTDRSTSAFQTNHNIYYARSPDGGTAWTKMDGTPYALPITAASAELVVPIPQNSTLINQSSMTVDANDRPLVATWWAPGAQQGNHTRQYMLAYYDGAAWQTSQITSRPSEPMQGDSTVRELARPLVMVTDDNRAVVVMRYKEAGNVVTIAHSKDRQNWNFVDLTSASLGIWEPTYDAELWQRENKLDLLYQPVGLGSTTSSISVLEWDARAYFLDLANNLTLRVDPNTGLARLENTSPLAISIERYSVVSASGSLDAAGFRGLAYQEVENGVWQNTSTSPGQLAEARSSGAMLLPSGGGFELGKLYNAAAGQKDLTLLFRIPGQIEDAAGVVLFENFSRPGDFNGDDVVDAADFTTWRDNLGSTKVLPNDTTPGEVTDADYNAWKAGYGMTVTGAGSADSATSDKAIATPEPSSTSIVLIAVLLGLSRRYVQRRVAGEEPGR